MVGKIGVVDQRQASLVAALPEHAMQLGGCAATSAGDHQRGIPEVDDGDFAAAIDSPAVTKHGRKAGLPPVGDTGSRHRSRHRNAL